MHVERAPGILAECFLPCCEGHRRRRGRVPHYHRPLHSAPPEKSAPLLGHRRARLITLTRSGAMAGAKPVTRTETIISGRTATAATRHRARAHEDIVRHNRYRAHHPLVQRRPPVTPTRSITVSVAHIGDVHVADRPRSLDTRDGRLRPAPEGYPRRHADAESTTAHESHQRGRIDRPAHRDRAGNPTPPRPPQKPSGHRLKGANPQGASSIQVQP